MVSCKSPVHWAMFLARYQPFVNYASLVLDLLGTHDCHSIQINHPELLRPLISSNKATFTSTKPRLLRVPFPTRGTFSFKPSQTLHQKTKQNKSKIKRRWLRKTTWDCPLPHIHMHIPLYKHVHTHSTHSQAPGGCVKRLPLPLELGVSVDTVTITYCCNPLGPCAHTYKPRPCH